jgi:hypothetical protein
MRIILENIDGSIYGDIIISPREIETLKMGEMVDSMTYLDKKKCYIGVRLQGSWDEEEEKQIEEEDS